MRKISSSTTFQSDIETIWNIITDVSDYAWRSDWRKVTGSEDPNQFTVYSKDGNHSEFTIICRKPYNHYEFTMENDVMTGRWVGNLSTLPEGGTRMDIHETIDMKNRYWGFLSHLFLNMKKTHQIYIRDLKEKLKEKY